jgi:uracil-DNA glycosylase family 4
MARRELELVSADIVACRACPRLVEWRERVAREKVARYAHEEYWGRPVPGFGDAAARILVLGLAPAAHGGNRTGRAFTGDRSGAFLYPSLHRTGLSNQATSTGREDGLRLLSTYIGAVNRCAPPENRPTTVERDACLPYLEREIAALDELRVIVALGSYAWDGALRALASLGHERRPKPRFSHGAEAEVGPFTILGTYHPSQRNTFTGTLTPEMLDAVFERAGELAGLRGPRSADPSPASVASARRTRPARGSSGAPGSGRVRG